jgi:quinohemoprotein ethanol dehydrogenase
VNGRQHISVLVGWGSNPAANGGMGDPKLRMTYRDGGRRLLTFALGGRATYLATPPPIVIPIDIVAFKPDSAKVLQGQNLFGHNCSGCHGGNVVSGGLTPDLRASLAVGNPTAFRDVVLGALELRGMPKFYYLSSKEIDSIYHYIRFRARQDLKEQGQGNVRP